MILKNINIYTEEKIFKNGYIVIKNNKINRVIVDKSDNLNNINGKTESGTHNTADQVSLGSTDEEIIDGKGAYAIPGLIDLHFHGCVGHDFCDSTPEAIQAIADYEASVGVTSIAPATMTLPVEELEHILKTAADYKKEPHTGADLVGINMEGPFISPVKKGAQDPRNIIPCDEQIFQRFWKASEGLVSFMGIAPEESEQSVEFIKAIKDQVHVSLAHTNADYDTAMTAFEAGADHAVHLYNAMPAYTHRAPGVIGAVADCEHVKAELICDGIHIHPAVVRNTFRMLGEDRIIFISDSMRATGMPNGQYTLGGLDVKVTGKLAVLVSDGAIAGSATHLMDCMRTAVKEMGIPLEKAVACATMNPAKQLGIYEECGSLTEGKKADIVLLDENLDLPMVIKNGEIL